MPRGEQLIRQWGILNLIESYHYGITIENLATEVGCTTRTIRRDLDALESTGFPLYTEEIDGEVRWKLLNAFKNAPHTPFTITEILSLYFSRDLLKVLKPISINGVKAKVLRSKQLEEGDEERAQTFEDLYQGALERIEQRPTIVREEDKPGQPQGTERDDDDIRFTRTGEEW